jgi:plasmid replication initiation protein
MKKLSRNGEKDMSQLVVKDNRLVEANYRLTLNEQRLILLACTRIKKHSKYEDVIEIHASDYAKQFNVAVDDAYKSLKNGNETLFTRYLSYSEIDPYDNREIVSKLRWCDRIGYKRDSAILYLRFTKEIFPLISQLEKNFTQYELDSVSQFTSIYSHRLYELLIKWKSQWHTPVISLEHLRTMFGIDKKEYATMSDFKKKVLDFAVAQINKFSNIELYIPEDKKSENGKDKTDYIQIKSGRKIVGFQFYFREKRKPQKTKTLKSDFIKMTDSQRMTFSAKLSRLPELSHLAKGSAGQSYEAFAIQIAEELKDKEKQKKYVQYLEKVGFNVGYSSQYKNRNSVDYR